MFPTLLLHFYLIFFINFSYAKMAPWVGWGVAPTGAEISKIHISSKKEIPGILTSYICRGTFFFFGKIVLFQLQCVKKKLQNFFKKRRIFFLVPWLCLPISCQQRPPSPLDNFLVHKKHFSIMLRHFLALLSDFRHQRNFFKNCSHRSNEKKNGWNFRG